MLKFEIKKLLLTFAIGYFFYQAIEVNACAIYHKNLSLIGESSVWMGVIGALSLIILGQFNERSPIRHYPMIIHTLIGGIIIILLEFFSGLILNVWLSLNIWSYADKFANLLGQICLENSIYWFTICPFAFWLDDKIRWIFYRQRSSNRILQYKLLDYYKALFCFNKNIIKYKRRNHVQKT
jgi:uncharacterized membrane protein